MILLVTRIPDYQKDKPNQKQYKKAHKDQPKLLLGSFHEKTKTWKSLGGEKKEHGLLHLKDAMFRCKQGVVDILMDGIKYHLKEEQDQ